MSDYTYKEVVKKAEEVQKNIKEKYESGVHNKWGHYFCKAMLNPKKDVAKKIIASAPAPSGDYLSRQIKKDDLNKIFKHIVDFAESRNRMPNFVTWNGKHIRVRDYINMASYCLVFQSKNGRIPNYYNINSKAFIKPTPVNTILEAFIKAFGKVTTFTDALRKVQSKGYGYYFEDVLPNLQVIEGLKKPDGKKPNCVDICQMMWNVAIGLGYDVRCMWVYCPRDDITHVRLQVKHSKYTDGEWEDYDPAAVADGECIDCLWCNGSGSYVIGINPDWFMAGVNR